MLSGCVTGAAFYRVRRAIAESVGVNRRAVRPSTPLESLFGRKRRRKRWEEFRRALELKVPGLQAPGAKGWNEKQVWSALCGLIESQTGIERARITPEARIVDDLGID